MLVQRAPPLTIEQLLHQCHVNHNYVAGIKAKMKPSAMFVHKVENTFHMNPVNCRCQSLCEENRQCNSLNTLIPNKNDIY